MQRALTTERLFSMGSFANLRFSHTISEIPNEIATNQEAMKALEYLLLLDVEYDYRRYLLLIEKVTKTDPQEILNLIDGERTTTFENLFKQSHKGE